jgi:hypothetical protein
VVHRNKKKIVIVFFPLLHYSSTPLLLRVVNCYSDKIDKQQIVAPRLILQRNIPMPLIDRGSLFVAQHSECFN